LTQQLLRSAGVERGIPCFPSAVFESTYGVKVHVLQTQIWISY